MLHFEFLIQSPLWVLLVPLCPLAAFVVQIFIGRFLPRKGDWVSLAAISVSLLVSLGIFYEMMLHKDPKFSVAFPSVTWVSVPGFAITMGILLDNIAAIMLVVVSTVSFLVHLYSIGYMHGDSRYNRFFGYLSLFSFSMYGLILANNLIALYCFWELVGLSSYLLIGFWFEKKSAADACKKAFITNRIGDFGFLLGILMVIFFLKQINYVDVFAALSSGQGGLHGGWLTFAGVCLFMGAVGKSAQFPLHVWLPDAMEGPTPVSALIHAATMVAAGVYMITRLYPVFTPDALLIIAYVGGFTAIFAATIALVQNDIKRVLAYSTVSQLGFMVLGLGVGGYVAGFFHLWTHAYFKALLFLCSGSVIHALHSQDLREMGGLWKKMPITFITMTIGALAIAGFPPYFVSGFYSKDGILGAALAFAMEHPQHILLAAFGFAGAGLTAFYMFRLIYMTFTGSPRDHHKHEHAHESPLTMTVPLIILAILSIISAGFFGGSGWFGEYVQKPESAALKAEAALSSAAPAAHAVAEAGHYAHTAHLIAVIGSILIVIIALTLATLFYYEKYRMLSAEKVAARLRPVYNLLLNKYYVDEIYRATVVAGVFWFSKFCRKFDNDVVDGAVNASAKATVFVSFAAGQHDLAVIDGAVNGVANFVLDSGKGASMVQTGRVKNYIAWAVGSIIVILGLVYFLIYSNGQ